MAVAYTTHNRMLTVALSGDIDHHRVKGLVQDLEREIVAQIVRYNTLPLDPYEEVADVLSQEEYLCVAKLSAILRVANALDQSHKQKFKNIRIAVRERKLVITVEAFEDIALEQALFDAKTSYFENVYSMKPVLKEKRIYNY